MPWMPTAVAGAPEPDEPVVPVVPVPVPAIEPVLELGPADSTAALC